MTLSKYAYIIERQRQIITDYRNSILLDQKSPFLFEKKEVYLYEQFIEKAGAKGVAANPFDEYNKIAVAAFDEMRKDIEKDVINGMKAYAITENGIDMDAAGMGNATTTWTYLIDDNQSQFCALPRLMKKMSRGG